MNTLGRYTILENEGAGATSAGKGITWRKAFNHTLRCYATIALIPRAAFPTDESRQQFETEVANTSGIRHRNVASVFPLEVISDTYVYAMEFCDGETLAARVLRTGAIEALEALEIANQLAAGLGAASSAGLLHRNIAAENVLVIDEEGELSVKLLGLGFPAGHERGAGSGALPEPDFRSPEEMAGKQIDVRSAIYSLAALLYFMATGPEAYQEFRARSLDGKTRHLLAEQIPHRLRLVLSRAVNHNPIERVGTFLELIQEIERARTAPEEPEVQEIAAPARADDAVEVATSPEPEMEEGPVKSAEPREGELTIPAELLGVAQPGTVLRLSGNETESRQQVVIWVGNTFRIGRAADAQLVTRFLPRNKANDTQTRRLSKIHATVKCDNGKLCLYDGSGVKPSANGSTFDGKPLSAENSVQLDKPGELKLANAYVVKIIPLLDETDGAPGIANLADWNGPPDGPVASMTGAVLFVDNETKGSDTTLWLFSTAAFGPGNAFPVDFTSAAKAAALRHFRGCFWVEQRSTEALVLNGLALARGEVAPLASGQTLEVKGSSYVVELQDLSKQQKA